MSTSRSTPAAPKISMMCDKYSWERIKDFTLEQAEDALSVSRATGSNDCWMEIYTQDTPVKPFFDIEEDMYDITDPFHSDVVERRNAILTDIMDVMAIVVGVDNVLVHIADGSRVKETDEGKAYVKLSMHIAMDCGKRIALDDLYRIAFLLKKGMGVPVDHTIYQDSRRGLRCVCCVKSEERGKGEAASLRPITEGPLVNHLVTNVDPSLPFVELPQAMLDSFDELGGRLRGNMDDRTWERCMGAADDISSKDVVDLLGMIHLPEQSSEGRYQKWLRVSMFVKAALGDDGFDIWHAWCEREPGFNPRENMHQTWLRHLQPRSCGNGVGALYNEAKRSSPNAYQAWRQAKHQDVFKEYAFIDDDAPSASAADTAADNAKRSDPVDVSDDDAAARFVAAAGAENMVMVGRDLFVFDAETGLWSDEEKVFKRLVHKHKVALKFPKRNYGGDEYLMARMKKCISNHVRDEDNFWEDKYDTAIGYLLFSDGILNMRTGEFREGFNPAIVFKGRIDRPYYGGSPDADALAMVDKMIFEDPFTKEQIEQGVPVYQKKAWGRSLAGTYRDRQGYWNIGGTATSKGLTCTAVTESCGSYVGAFDINAFKFNPGSTSDAAKQLSWVVPIAYKRIILSNEPPQGVTLNGNLLKLFVSGGDGMVVRQCNQNERTVVNRATPHLFGNDAPKIKPVDEALGDRFGGVVEYKVSFTLTANGSQPDVEKRRDIHAKDIFKQDKYRDAFLHVLITAFQDYLRNGHERPEVIVKAMQEWFIEENSLESVLDGGFDVTGNESDYITFKELWEFCRPRLGDTCSKKKLGIDLAKIAGVKKGDKKIRGKCTVVYYGLARVEEGWAGDDEA
jgi:hypothetical protein